MPPCSVAQNVFRVFSKAMETHECVHHGTRGSDASRTIDVADVCPFVIAKIAIFERKSTRG